MTIHLETLLPTPL